ncbi:DsbA family protein [Sphingomonas sp.]|uniref:DsbA family protein n=1 Tax=Sphingomonas sp. TaxID=28214 RepID=UPI0035BC25CC
MLAVVALIGAVLGAAGVVAYDRASPGPLGAGDTARVERVVRAYVLAHPELIPEAMQRLQDREQGKAVAAAGDLTRPFGAAWTGNPQGDVTLVEFYDYNCGYCRASLPLLKQLVQRDPKLRIVYRELPILAPSSRAAARASLLAAAQGRFAAFHDALYAGGQVSDATIAAAAARAGVDLAQAAAFNARADAEIARNLKTAGALGLTGTPSWVVGDRVLAGALPIEQIEAAIAAARRS